MKLEQQVCSLELAKKLKELGVKQESLFWWKPKIEGGHELRYRESGMSVFYEDYSAFTVAELGEMLPDEISSTKIDYKKGKGAFWEVKNTINSDLFNKFNGETVGKHQEIVLMNTEADARGKMVCYLLENKLITL